MKKPEERKKLKDINKIFFGMTIGFLLGLMVTVIPMEPFWKHMVFLAAIAVSAIIYDKA